MLAAYAEGRDIYAAIAEPMGLDRAAGKLLILAMSYGVGPDKIATELKVTQKRAKEILKSFEDEYPALTKYKEQVIKEAAGRRPVPYVRTILGRRRILGDLRNGDYGARARAERQAFNARIQGSAAEVIKVAMIRVHSMKDPDIKMLLTVHDEILLLSPDELVDEAAAVLKEGMEGVLLPGITVPLTAEVHTVQRWGDAK